MIVISKANKESTVRGGSERGEECFNLQLLLFVRAEKIKGAAVETEPESVRVESWISSPLSLAPLVDLGHMQVAATSSKATSVLYWRQRNLAPALVLPLPQAAVINKDHTF